MMLQLVTLEVVGGGHGQCSIELLGVVPIWGGKL